jgi:hypothetical protein
MATFLFLVFVLPILVVLVLSFIAFVGPPLLAAGLFYLVCGLDAAYPSGATFYVYLVVQVSYLVWLAEGEDKRKKV